MNGDPEFYQSDDGHVYGFRKGFLRCAYSKFMMDANGVYKEFGRVQKETRS
jgi:hypothetical protein